MKKTIKREREREREEGSVCVWVDGGGDSKLLTTTIVMPQLVILLSRKVSVMRRRGWQRRGVALWYRVGQNSDGYGTGSGRLAVKAERREAG